jgi:cell division protein FtsQ
MHGKLLTLLRPFGMEVVRVSLSPRGSWEIELKRGEVIELGRGSAEDVLARLERFAHAIQRPGAQWAGRNWDRADLRHMDGFALHLKATAPSQAAQ